MPYPYLLPAIYSTHDINDLPGKYTGTGEVSFFHVLTRQHMLLTILEFLVYGSIECRPIVVLDNI